ncbi:hypothetical protein ACLB1R_16770 [Escherichia coli]
MRALAPQIAASIMINSTSRKWYLSPSVTDQFSDLAMAYCKAANLDVATIRAGSIVHGNDPQRQICSGIRVSGLGAALLRR